MESIANFPPHLAPRETPVLLNNAVSAYKKETAKLLDMTQEPSPLEATLGKKIDVKA